MSLWHKAIQDLTFNDIDAFCQTMQAEGLRLDYKVERPPDLAKLIAAFANTLGGMIVLGVEADQKTNRPIWPPQQKGMPTKPGIDEAITSIARDAIYPPVRIGISPIIENELLRGHSIVVVRVDESKEAPHAVDKGRKIYERTGSVNDPYDIARIDRIEHLITRRRRIEDEREDIRLKAITRSRKLVSEDLKPIVWLSVIPIYPWKEVCKPSACYNHFRYSPSYSNNGAQRIPDGGIHITEVNTPELGQTTSEVVSCDSRGHFLCLRGLVEIVNILSNQSRIFRPEEMKDRSFTYQSVIGRLTRMIEKARDFYNRQDVEKPGLLSVKIGMSCTENVRIYNENSSHMLNYGVKSFLDNYYDHELVLSFEEFLSDKGRMNNFYDRIAFAFDVSTPDSQ